VSPFIFIRTRRLVFEPVAPFDLRVCFLGGFLVQAVFGVEIPHSFVVFFSRPLGGSGRFFSTRFALVCSNRWLYPLGGPVLFEDGAFNLFVVDGRPILCVAASSLWFLGTTACLGRRTLVSGGDGSLKLDLVVLSTVYPIR